MFITNTVILSSKKEKVESSGFEFQKLPYEYSFLEPVIDAETMKIHHTRHQKKYFDNMMSIVDENSKLQKNSLVELMSDLNKIPAKDREKFKNNAGGYFNHSFFWNVMTTEKPVYSGAIKNLIDKKFGSLDKFKIEFIKTGMDHFGSGWVWLCTEDGRNLKLSSMANQNNPYIEECGKPLIGCDLWEHAYYLKYKNQRDKYIHNFWKVVNWEFVNDSYVTQTKK
jgi:Fe-Mn family superoxide dismutase